jgi:hypothetical protein
VFEYLPEFVGQDLWIARPARFLSVKGYFGAERSAFIEMTLGWAAEKDDPELMDGSSKGLIGMTWDKRFLVCTRRLCSAIGDDDFQCSPWDLEI